MKGSLDKYLNVVVKYLFIKCQEKNVFLTKEVYKSFDSIVEHCNANKILH